MKYDRFTRLLHLLMVIGVMLQLLTSLAMDYPKPGRPENEWYEFHEIVGLCLFGIFIVHWLWSIIGSLVFGEALMLFPWGSARRRSELMQDIRTTAEELRHFRLPVSDRLQPLPAAIQGLGLLLGLFMAATGMVLFFGIDPNVKMSNLTHDVKEIYEAAATLLWVFVAIHPTLGILHQLAGHKSLSRIFDFGR